MYTADTSQLVAALARIVGDAGVISGERVAERAEAWNSPRASRARAIVRPRTANEVAAVMQLCTELHQPVVPFGGGTGLVDGAIAGSHELLLSLERMRAIEHIDPAGRTITVQAGVTLQAVQSAARDAGLMFPLDLGARGTATVGGIISTNAGGNRVLRYGMMRDQVLGLEVVLADGTTLTSMNGLIKNNAGYDLRQLFIGSEGTLGIVTRAVLRLREATQSQNVALVAVGGVDALISLLKAVDRGLGGTLSAFEVMWPEFYELVATGANGRLAPPLKPGLPLYCLVESMGGSAADDRSRFLAVMGEQLEAGTLIDAVVAESQSQVESLWALRDDVERVLGIGPVFMFDVGLPVLQIKDYVLLVRRNLAAKWTDFKCVVWGHFGDCNLHIWISVQDDSTEARHAVERIVYEPLRSIGGTVSAEHGIGVEKRAYLGYCRTAFELDVMCRLKAALDPSALLNPGKIIPETGLP